MAAPSQAIRRADVQAVAPALDHYTQERPLAEVWTRPGLSARDRSLITVAALIARNQAIEMRARQKHVIEERAQKAPIKILFPFAFLIFPVMFLVILGPAPFDISKSLHG